MNFTPCLYIASPAPAPPDEQRGHAKGRIHWLGSVEDILRRVVGSEARLWLCSALASLSVPDNVKASVFLELLRHATTSSSSSTSRFKRDKDDGERVLKQVVRMLCDSCPRQVAGLLLNDSKMLHRFFSGQSKRVLQWFQNFAGVGETDHQLGARALSRYAFMHRETYWHELVWKGNRSQAPATMASKPHYFSELDILKTIDNFLDNVPSFWSSQELRDSLKDGRFLALDIDFFIEELLGRMSSGNFSDMWQLVKTYLAEESFSVLCQRTLPIVSDNHLLEFLNDLGAAIVKRSKGNNVDWEKSELAARDLECSLKESLWLEAILSAGVEWETLSDAIFCNACATHGRELLRLLQSDEQQEESQLLCSLMSERHLYDEKQHWKLREECLLVRKSEAVKWLSLEAWVLFYLLLQENTSTVSLEGMMTENGIGFLPTDSISNDKNEMDSEGRETGTIKERRSRKRQRKKLKGRSRKKLKHGMDDDSDSDSDQPTVTGEFNKQTAVSWKLSLDDYVITWTKVDVVEHLVNYALRHWLRWTVLRW